MDDVLIEAALHLYGIDINLPESQRSMEPERFRALHDRLLALGQIDPEPEFT